MRWWQWRPQRRPTLLLRCILLVSAELAVNALLWVVAAIVFRHRTRFLTLSVLAWTLGLRHALDADHISVIDNATRRIVSIKQANTSDHGDRVRPRRPVTCGLWFSLGHSTIVVAVICAIALSLSVVDRLGSVRSVGGIVGAAVSGSTLFLFAVVNSILLSQSVRASHRYRRNQHAETLVDETNVCMAKAVPAKTPVTEAVAGARVRDHRFRGIFTRLAYPLFRLVDRPYKLYPIGILFGLGFDTASSIALLGIAGATDTQVQDTDLEADQNILSDNSTRHSDASIILLALLFTAGMTLVDSLDSVLMINAYAPGDLLGPSTEQSVASQTSKWRAWLGRLRFFESCEAILGHTQSSSTNDQIASTFSERKLTDAIQTNKVDDSPLQLTSNCDNGTPLDQSERTGEDLADVGESTSSGLSHLLTLLSILLAFAISIITLMGLIGENCDKCVRAATKQAESHNGGLEGRWWLFWQKANDASGIIGACIVAGFAVILVAWYTGRAAYRYRGSHH